MGRPTTPPRTWAGWSSCTPTRAWPSRPTTPPTTGWARILGWDPRLPWPLITWSLQWASTRNTLTSTRWGVDQYLCMESPTCQFNVTLHALLGAGTVAPVQPTSRAAPAGRGQQPLPSLSLLKAGARRPILSSSNLFWGANPLQRSRFGAYKIGALLLKPSSCLHFTFPGSVSLMYYLARMYLQILRTMSYSPPFSTASALTVLKACFSNKL